MVLVVDLRMSNGIHCVEIMNNRYSGTVPTNRYSWNLRPRSTSIVYNGMYSFLFLFFLFVSATLLGLFGLLSTPVVWSREFTRFTVILQPFLFCYRYAFVILYAFFKAVDTS